VKFLGLDHVIDYTKDDYSKGIKNKISDIQDKMLNDSFKESARLLKPDGYVIPTSSGTDLGKWFGAIPAFPQGQAKFDCELLSNT
jgi:NADPH:quinone reductase-like Zn-dependent oxidoreductase